MNDDLTPILESLGFRDIEHCVTFNPTNSEEKIFWVFNPNNFEMVDRIREKEMHLSQKLHVVSNRARAMHNFFNSGTVTYTFPTNFVLDGPCPMVCFTDKAPCDSMFVRYALYECDRSFYGIKPVLSQSQYNSRHSFQFCETPSMTFLIFAYWENIIYSTCLFRHSGLTYRITNDWNDSAEIVY